MEATYAVSRPDAGRVLPGPRAFWSSGKPFINAAIQAKSSAPPNEPLTRTGHPTRTFLYSETGRGAGVNAALVRLLISCLWPAPTPVFSQAMATQQSLA